jgi:hypothetical protein
MTLVFSCLTQMILVHKLALVKAVFRIHDILVWIRIRIRGCMPLINGSEPGSGRLFVFKAIFRRSVMYMRNKYPNIFKPRTGNI